MTSTSDSTVITVNLVPEQFTTRERTVLRAGRFHVTAGRSASGIELLTIDNEVGRVVVLPFVGQQVWDAAFHGRHLTMQSIFDAPVPTSNYLENYGAYLIHCGGSAMGNPGPDDAHPLHGELPNLRLKSASLRLDRVGADDPLTLTVLGSGDHRVAFTTSFRVDLALTLTEHSGVMDSAVRITNGSRQRRPLMYLAHVNFRPAPGGHLEQRLRPDAGTETRGDIHVHDSGRTARVSVAELDSGAYPIRDLLLDGRQVTPELVQLVPLDSDSDGWARCRQVHADGSRDLVAQEAASLPQTVRWMCRSADDDAFGFALPATAGPEGRAVESALGRVTMFDHEDGILARFRHGALAPGEKEPPLLPTPFHQGNDRRFHTTITEE